MVGSAAISHTKFLFFVNWKNSRAQFIQTFGAGFVISYIYNELLVFLQ